MYNTTTKDILNASLSKSENFKNFNMFKRSMSVTEFKDAAQKGTLPRGNILVRGYYEQGNYLKTAEKCFLGQLSDELNSMTIIIPGRIRRTMENKSLMVIVGKARNTSKWGYRLIVNYFQLGNKEDDIVDERADFDGTMNKECFNSFFDVKKNYGFKNVPAIFEKTFLKDRLPTLACIFPDSSVARSDFYEGLGEAIKFYSITEEQIPFIPNALASTLDLLDGKGFDAIAIIRGGGSHMEVLDSIELSNTVVQMTTPIIYGCGHDDDDLFIRHLVDLDRPIPYALGCYLKKIALNQ